MISALNPVLQWLPLILVPVLVIIVVILLLRLQRLQSMLQSQPMFPAPVLGSASAPATEPEPGGDMFQLYSESEELELSPATEEVESPPAPIELNHSDPLDNKAWLGLVEECVGLFDELDRHFDSFDPPRQELADHVLLRLREILERSGVELIADEPTFELHRHKPEQTASSIAPGVNIAQTLSPGFVVGPRVLRRARVRLAEVSS